ncbi:hypothetical protein [Goodfellowiella coeruleoviolacea]|uniref:Uncharacterized protein n=1 Tax=Goodfellowiella coeruleoviolacea TaxID=334858 RepID=A0AAE3GIZ2_9PSEU|nr:hypothetical protein [Goodfellowiella coeruleoviolacea]MCP2168282.1 hypothetical protein [Goodfellowiella coeruleoviolacea]
MTYAYVLCEVHNPNRICEWYEKLKVELVEISDVSPESLREHTNRLREWGLRELTAGQYDDAKYAALLVEPRKDMCGNDFVDTSAPYYWEDIFWFDGYALVEPPSEDTGAPSLTLRLDKDTTASYLGAASGEPALVVATADGQVTFEPSDPAHLTHDDLRIAHRLLVAAQAFHDACWRGCAQNRINTTWRASASD